MWYFVFFIVSSYYFQNIYNHTTLMMSYEMSHNFSNRRDLALTYYPSKFECYWFIARTVTLLRRYKATQPLPFKVRLNTIMECWLILEALYPILPVSLDCPFWLPLRYSQLLLYGFGSNNILSCTLSMTFSVKNTLPFIKWIENHGIETENILLLTFFGGASVGTVGMIDISVAERRKPARMWREIRQ